MSVNFPAARYAAADYANSAMEAKWRLSQSSMSKQIAACVNGPMAEAKWNLSQISLSKQIAACVSSPMADAIRNLSQSSLSKQIAACVNSPMAEAIRNLSQNSLSKQIAAYVNSPMAEAARNLSQSFVSKHIADYMNSPAMEAQRKAVAGISVHPMREAMEARVLAGIASRPLYEAIQQVESALARSAIIRTQSFSTSDKVSELTSSAHELSVGGPANDNEGDIAVLVQAVDHLVTVVETVATDWRRHADIQWLIGIAISIVVAAMLAHYQGLASGQDSDQTRGEIRKLAEGVAAASRDEHRDLTELGSRLDKLIESFEMPANQAKKVFRVVVRPVPLCRTQHHCRNHIVLLRPGTEVEVVDSHGDWVMIAVPWDGNETLRGWVPGKCLDE